MNTQPQHCVESKEEGLSADMTLVICLPMAAGIAAATSIALGLSLGLAVGFTLWVLLRNQTTKMSLGHIARVAAITFGVALVVAIFVLTLEIAIHDWAGFKTGFMREWLRK